jgi:hypothetical protein
MLGSRGRGASHRRVVLVAVAILGSGLAAPVARADHDEGVRVDVDVNGVVIAQDARCGPEDLPETGIQGDVPRADQDSGRAKLGYNCGLALVGHAVLDADGRRPTGNANMTWSGDCAYVAGPGAIFGEPSPGPGDGIAVVDVTDPTAPRHVRTLRTPGAVAALETLHAVATEDRAILVVGQYGNVAGGNKPMDVYDVSDCADPVLLETFHWPKNIHNLTISGNGRYVYATQPLQVADLEPLFDGDPSTSVVYLGDLEAETPSPPVAFGPTADLFNQLPLWVRAMFRSNYLSHEAWPSDDGTRLYVGGQLPVWETLTILDLTDWLDRDGENRPAGPPDVISQRSGRGHSVRTASVGDRRFLLHSEESVFGPAWGCLPQDLNPFAGPAQPWLTDITDETKPGTPVQFGLAINDPVHCPEQMSSRVNASVHYHDVDDPEDTTFVMASMWNAGLRVFDVRDPDRPVEVAYFNPADVSSGSNVVLDQAWGHVRWVPETGHIWFATASGGFWVVEMEPQVRRQLGLDGPPTDRPGRPESPGRPAEPGRPDGPAEPPPPHHPDGRPGTTGVEVRLAARPIVDFAPYACMLSPVASALSEVPVEVPPEVHVPPGMDVIEAVTGLPGRLGLRQG